MTSHNIFSPSLNHAILSANTIYQNLDDHISATKLSPDAHTWEPRGTALVYRNVQLQLR